jgi:hypothetical protein
MQCCIPTFRRDYLPPASWYLPQKIISTPVVILLQTLPEYNKQEAPIITRFFAGCQSLATKYESPSRSGSQPFSTPQIFQALLPKVLYANNNQSTVLYRVSKSLWWLQYRKLQVTFKVSPAGLQTFIDTPNCVLEDRVQYRTVHIPNVFCDGHFQIINCVGIFCTVIVRCTEPFWSDCMVTQQHTYPAVRQILISLTNHLYFHWIWYNDP